MQQAAEHRDVEHQNQHHRCASHYPPQHGVWFLEHADDGAIPRAVGHYQRQICKHQGDKDNLIKFLEANLDDASTLEVCLNVDKALKIVKEKWTLQKGLVNEH